MRILKCQCGGQHLQSTISEMGLELWGLTGKVEGTIPVTKCNRCGDIRYQGVVIEELTTMIATQVLVQPRLLSGQEAAFLRSSVLSFTQEELAECMQVDRTTIADWERGNRPISVSNDYVLRGRVLGTWIAQHKSNIADIQQSILLPKCKTKAHDSAFDYRISCQKFEIRA